MTIFKRIALLTTLVLVAFTTIACAQQVEGTEYNFDQDQVSVETIRVWLDDDSYANALIAAFEAANPGIKVIYEQVGAVDVRQRLELYGGSPAAADVVVFPHDHIGQALNSNLLYEITGSLATSLQTRMISSAIETATACYDQVNNRVIECTGDAQSFLFGAPLSGESVAMFYNKTLLEELTGSPLPAATFEEIIAHAATYATELEALESIMIGLDVGNAYDMHFAATAFGFKLFGDDHLDKYSPNLGSQEMIDALTWLNGTVKPALRNFDAGDLHGDANKTKFLNGVLPYMITGPWNIADFIDAGELNDFEFGVTQIPTINGQQPVTFSGVQMAAVYRGTRNPEAAFKFLEFMTSTEGLEIMYSTTFKLPALVDVSVVEGVSDDEYLSGISAQMVYSHPMPIIPEMGYFWSNAGSMYSQAWNGTRTPEQAATVANNGYLEQAGLVD
ncbi:extracellular solute-binding protein [Liberiplasma polymorphum]|uniref:extracellular solute-binding protein n=1 Tax=Liberiplasma polymorphum TaxID=3374570 RepID=UPI003770864D